MNDNKLQSAYKLGFDSTIVGEYVLHAVFDTAEEQLAYDDGLEEACRQLSDAS